MESNKPSTSSDEIDITQFFRWIGSGFTRMGNSILHSIASLRRLFFTYILFFSIVLVSGLIMGATYSGVIEKKYYTSSMIISCDYLNKRIMDNTIEKLNLLCSEKDREGLSETLKIDRTTAKNIIKFEAKNFVSENDRVELEVLKEQLANVAEQKKDLVNKVISKIEIGNVHSFMIIVKVYDPEIVKRLDSAIVNYFKSNEFIKKRMESQEATLISRKNKLIRESRKLDSLKAILFVNFQNMARQSREGSNNVILSDKYLTDPMSVFKEDLNINNEIRSIDQTLSIKPDFEVVDGLTTFKEPDNFGFVIVLIISLASSLAAGYIMLGLWKFNLYLARIEPAT